MDEDIETATDEAPLIKTCAVCFEPRTLSTFARSDETEDGRIAVCRLCTG